MDISIPLTFITESPRSIIRACW